MARIKCLNPYFIGLPILIIIDKHTQQKIKMVSILILLDYLFLYLNKSLVETISWSLNPYFIGLPILIIMLIMYLKEMAPSQSLFYWITYSYMMLNFGIYLIIRMSQSLFYWITYSYS